jgi:hypothetical protein
MRPAHSREEESYSGLPLQTVFDAPGEGGGAHSGLPSQTVFGALRKKHPEIAELLRENWVVSQFEICFFASRLIS